MLQVRLQIARGAIPVERQLTYALQQVGVRMSATSILHEAGAFEVLWTADSKEALEAAYRVAKHYQFDLREFSAE